MRLLVSTTIAHNPGDEIILNGVLNLLKAAWREDFEIVYYNRNPDLYTRHGRTMLPDQLGNYVNNNIDLRALRIDAVVLAGSPEWFGGPMEELYRGIVAAPEVPVFAVGIGLGDAAAQLSSLDLDALKRKNTYITTRSEETTAFLKKQGITSTPGICPAAFASIVPSINPKKEVGVIVQPTSGGWHSIQPELLQGLDSQFDKIVFHVKGLKQFPDAIHCANGTEALQTLCNYRKIMSTRLHGAIGALSQNRPAVVIASKDDFRIRTAAKMFSSIMPLADSYEDALECSLSNPNTISDFIYIEFVKQRNMFEWS